MALPDWDCGAVCRLLTNSDATAARRVPCLARYLPRLPRKRIVVGQPFRSGDSPARLGPPIAVRLTHMLREWPLGSADSVPCRIMSLPSAVLGAQDGGRALRYPIAGAMSTTSRLSMMPTFAGSSMKRLALSSSPPRSVWTPRLDRLRIGTHGRRLLPNTARGSTLSGIARPPPLQARVLRRLRRHRPSVLGPVCRPATSASLRPSFRSSALRCMLSPHRRHERGLPVVDAWFQRRLTHLLCRQADLGKVVFSRSRAANACSCNRERLSGR